MLRQNPASAGLVLALGSATLYGLNIGYARLASFAGVSGSTIVVYRVLLMMVMAGLAALVLGHSLRVAPQERPTIMLLGISTAIVGVCYLSSVAFIPVAVAVVVFYTFPVLIVLASPLVQGTKLTPALLGVVALALTGVVLVVGPAFGSLDPRGLALAVGASIATATQFFAAALARETGVFAKTFWIHLIVLPTAALIGAVAGNLEPPSSLLLAAIPVAITIGAYLLGFVLQFLALTRITAVTAGIAFCAEPVVAALAAPFILGETLSPVQILGGSLVIAAIVTNVILEGRRQAVVPAG
ncbi:MAG TPA: DMT family transporter [Microvirga sp.]|jgi:drug/metabolite transporter (DMT)-like permease|nr:DMT family transporter [Microvirga sp.]